jgi:uncharacterized peroxidase-related enzyme
MNRLHQIDPATASGKADQLFTAVKGKLGFVPNLMRVLGNSPASLEGYLNFSGALAGGVLAPKLREQIALAVAEINGCGYCLSAHTLLGGKAGLGAEEILSARKSVATESKSDAALKLARAVTLQRGMIADTDLQAARTASLSDAEIIEVVQHVALNILTNYTNNVAQTVIDFPEVKPGKLEPEACATGSGACSH